MLSSMAISKQCPIYRKLKKNQEQHHLDVPTKCQIGNEDMCRDNWRVVEMTIPRVTLHDETQAKIRTRGQVAQVALSHP